MLRAGLLALLAFAFLPDAAPAQENCAPDGQIMLLQDYGTFDQTGRGWRWVDRQPGCEAAAADLIARYLVVEHAILSEPEAQMLRWHEGQIRAGLGQDAAALALFTTTHSPEDAPLALTWNAYVDATVAFVKKDRAALVAARALLAAAPAPADFDAMAAQYEQQTGRRPQWPPNIDVVDAMITCFERPYRDAYADPACRT